MRYAALVAVNNSMRCNKHFASPNIVMETTHCEFPSEEKIQELSAKLRKEGSITHFFEAHQRCKYGPNSARDPLCHMHDEAYGVGVVELALCEMAVSDGVLSGSGRRKLRVRLEGYFPDCFACRNSVRWSKFHFTA